MTFDKQRLKGGEGISHVDVQRKTLWAEGMASAKTLRWEPVQREEELGGQWLEQRKQQSERRRAPQGDGLRYLGLSSTVRTLDFILSEMPWWLLHRDVT